MNAVTRKTRGRKSSHTKPTRGSKKRTLRKHLSIENVIEKHVAGKIDSAKEGYQYLIDNNYQGALPYSNLAGICIIEGKLEIALELAKKAIAIDPEFADAYIKLGCILELLNQESDEIIHSYEKAIKLDPENALVHFSLGNTLVDQGEIEQGMDSLQNAIRIKPDYAHALLNLGNLQTGSAQYDKAAQNFIKAVTADNSLRGALATHWHMRMRMCDWSEYSSMQIVLDAAIRESEDPAKTPDVINTIPPFTLFNIKDDPALHLKASEIYARTSMGSISQNTKPLYKERIKNQGNRIKIALLSSDYHNHATAYLIAELFELLDTERFEIHAISFGEKGHDSAMRKRIQSACCYFHDVVNQTDEEIAQLITDQEIDIAVDLKGFTTNSRPAILAYRPAPIQVNYLGYPGSMGADFIDYIIADPFVIPEEEQTYYREKIAYLPDSYQVNDRLRPIQDEIPSRESCGLPEEGFVFCSFNNNYKITPEVFDVWMDLLRETPDSVIWLLESNQWANENLKKEAASRGIDPSRLVFADLLRLDYHLARLPNANLFLDTLPCNAHTTASDALWAGLPLITCSGRSFAARVAGSLLTAIDLPELITSDLDSYKSLALELAHDSGKLNKIKEKLKKSRDACVLFDTVHYKDNLQRIFEHMTELQQAGSSPETFYVSELKNRPQRQPVNLTKAQSRKFNFEDTPGSQEITLEDVIKKHIAGDIGFAKKGYQAFIDAKHPDITSYSNLASIYFQENNIEKAIELLRGGLEINPDYVDAWMKLGSLLEVQKKGDYQHEVINCYKKAIQLKPDHAIAHFSLGNVLAEQKQIEQAISSLQNAISLQPDYALAHFNLGGILSKQGTLDEAARAFFEASQIDHTFKSAVGKFWHARMHMCDWSEYDGILSSIQSESSSINLTSDISKVTSPFTLLNIFDNPALHLKTSKEYLRARLATIQFPEPLCAGYRKEAGNPIKIAFLSADFHNHATAILMAGLLELFDKDQFEIYAVSFSQNDNSGMQKRIHSAFDHFYEVIDKSDKEVAEIIASQGIDIAVDLKGFTQDSRPAILAYRPAPIQVNYLGYPGSMGANFIDYIIADPFVIPEKEQSHYSENIIYLPDSYQVNDHHRETHPDQPSRESCGLPTDGFIFCCFNQSYKITPDVFDVWMELLKETPGSVLWLLDSNQWANENLKREADSRGVNPSRLIFAGQLPVDQHLARIQNADLFLDTFPCNAHTTASDALWVGLPLITCSGRGFATRVAGSLLKAVDLEELITTDPESYKTLAIELSHNPEKINQIKTKLKENHETWSLFNTEEYTKNLQKGFSKIIDLHLKGCDTKTFHVRELSSELVEDQLSESNVEELPIQENSNTPIINIVLIRPQNYIHSSAFNEIAETLYYSFKEIGFVAHVTENTFIEDGINIILCAHLLNISDYDIIPNSSILYNLELITEDSTSPWMTPEYFDLFNKLVVWDINKKNLPILKKKGVSKKVHHVPLGYYPGLTRISKPVLQDIDVLFYGSVNQRRQDILNGLIEAGLKVEVFSGLFGKQRDDYISRAKVVVHIHYFEGNIFDQARIFYLLANKKAVVSEWGDTSDLGKDLEEAVALVPYDQIIEKCCELVKSESLRCKLEDKGFSIMEKRDSTGIITNALNALGSNSEEVL